MTRKEVQFRKQQRAELKTMLKDINKTLKDSLEKSFDCGAVPENWKEDQNALLARTVVDNFCLERNYRLRNEQYARESKNIQLFL